MIYPNQKQKTIRLKDKALTELRIKAYTRDGEMCVECQKWLPLEGDIYTRAHMAHKKSRGAGGGDTLDNVEIRCYDCHILKQHSPQWTNGSLHE